MTTFRAPIFSAISGFDKLVTPTGRAAP